MWSQDAVVYDAIPAAQVGTMKPLYPYRKLQNRNESHYISPLATLLAYPAAMKMYLPPSLSLSLTLTNYRWGDVPILCQDSSNSLQEHIRLCKSLSLRAMPTGDHVIIM